MFGVINIVTCFHAYRFTHFGSSDIPFTPNPEHLKFREKLSALVFGVSLPRPENTYKPRIPFRTFRIKNNSLECWEIPAKKTKGTVLLFHGYANKKSGMIDRAYAFHDMGYRVILTDFEGCGGSLGSTTTIGFSEAEDVKSCYDFARNIYPDQPVILLGSSMGAAAIMKCMKDYPIKPSAVILECPFGSMYKTVCNRFDAVGVPSFPMAALLVFYGGLLNGFWAFDHNPIDYAAHINCPVLLLNGGKDERVSKGEIDAIYKNLKGEKKKIIYPDAGHESYLNGYETEWKSDVKLFLKGKK